MQRPFIVGVGGFTSNVGKTSLMCDLLREFPQWEAIKTTRGHYRSCGKDAHACCVSHLLSEKPVILSGRSETYSEGKDTGRYWMAGATNVHWLIATDEQLEIGIRKALQRVKAPGVLIEGNSFSKFVKPDYFLMVKRSDSEKIKSSARQTLVLTTAIYVTNFDNGSDQQLGNNQPVGAKIYSQAHLPELIDDLRIRLQTQRR